MSFRKFIGAALTALFLGAIASAQEIVQPPIEAYGDREAYRSAVLSPDGKTVAFIARQDGDDYLATWSAESGLTVLSNLSNIDGVWIDDFMTEQYLILRGYSTARVYGYEGEVDNTAAISLDLKSGETNQLLYGSKDMYPAQSGVGWIVGRISGTNEVLMPAITGSDQSDFNRAVYKVHLDRQKGRIFERGTRETIGWLFAPDGTLLAREDMNGRAERFRIYTRQGDGKLRKILEVEDVKVPPYSVLGVTADQSGLILSDHIPGSSEQYMKLQFDGTLTPFAMGEKTNSVSNIFTDPDQVIFGLKYAGLQPSYEFFDPKVDQAISNVVEQFPTGTVHVLDWSEDWSTVLLSIFDNGLPTRYVLLDVESGALTGLISERKGIPSEALGDVLAIDIPARDGLTLPTLITWPTGVPKTATNLPMIMMPHGGPRSYDAVGFDFMAQYFANRGYLVVQPNFRGSSGFGEAYMMAGNGEWGGKMQDDITDAVKAMFAGDMVDPERVCIVGWSYGGYAALAGGGLTPDLYKCVVAIAPVTDLRDLFRDEKQDHGKNHFILNYWEEMIGDPKTEKAKLEATSPVNMAENFTAPVLLIHGDDDRVVQYDQSTRMKRALERAGKSVELMRIKKEGHALLDGEERLKMLQKVSDFVETNIGE